MRKYILKSNAICSMPVYIEAESYDEAIKKTLSDYTFKEVECYDNWDIKVLRLSDTKPMPPCYDECKYFCIRFG